MPAYVLWGEGRLGGKMHLELPFCSLDMVFINSHRQSGSDLVSKRILGQKSAGRERVTPGTAPQPIPALESLRGLGGRTFSNGSAPFLQKGVPVAFQAPSLAIASGAWRGEVGRFSRVCFAALSQSQTDPGRTVGPSQVKRCWSHTSAYLALATGSHSFCLECTFFAK